MRTEDRRKAEARLRALLPETYTGDDCLTEAGGALREKFPEARAAIVVMDDTVDGLYGDKLANSLMAAGFIVVKYMAPEGREGKNISAVKDLLESIGNSHVDKRDILIAFGGGSLCDCTGFAAGSYMGGIPYVLFPTTLAAAVSSTVGGVSWLDLDAGEDLLSLKYPPAVVFCDTGVLNALDQQMFCDGAAEMIRLGALASPTLLETLQYNYRNMLEDVIRNCMKIRASFYAGSETEGDTAGLLHFGETIGGILRRASRGKVSSGQALAVGMAVMSRAAYRSGMCSVETYAPIEKALLANCLPTGCRLTAEQFFGSIVMEQTGENVIPLILPVEPGRCAWYPMPVQKLREFLEAGLSD